MKLDDEPVFPITKTTAEKILGICRSVTVLQTKMSTDGIVELKKLLSSDSILQQQTKNLLGAGNLVQFDKRLQILKNAVTELLTLSRSESFDFSGKDGLKETLETLDTSVLTLQNEMARKSCGNR